MPSAYLAVIFAGGVTGLVFAIALWRIYRDRRRPANGLWLLAALTLLWFTALLAAAFLPRGDYQWLSNLLSLPILGVPLLLAAAAIALMANTPIVIRREGLRIATLVPLAIALAIFATLIVSFVWFLNLTAFDVDSSTRQVLLLPILMIPGAVFFIQLAAFTGYAALYARLPSRTDSDVIVVLGAGLNGDAVTPLLAGRLDQGIQEFRAIRGAAKHCFIVVSGGKGSDEKISEAEAMATYLIDKGVPAEPIIQETESTTTEENLAYTAAKLAELGLQWSHMRIVTSDFHVLRSASLSRQLGLNASTVGARTAAYYLPSAFLREFAAIVVHYRRSTAITCLVAILLWIAWWAIG